MQTLPFFAGRDRYQTARIIAEDFNSSKCSNIILASGNDFPDALTASILSKKLDAPILLVDSAANSSNSVEAFNYINAHVSDNPNFYIIGGPGVIGTDFETKLSSMGYNSIKRLGGSDRYNTGMLIVNEANVPAGTPVFVASGESFPDALSVSSFSGSEQYPIILVGTNYLPDRAKDYFMRNKPSEVYIAGGFTQVSLDIENQIKELIPDAAVRRLSRDDLYTTSVAALEELSIVPNIIYLADGYNFPDALSGSGLAAKKNAPIFLINPKASSLPTVIETYLGKLHNEGLHPKVQALGGVSAVPDILIEQAENALYGKSTIINTKIIGLKNEYSGCYLDSTGHVWAWGFGSYEFTRNNTTFDSLIPIKPNGFPTY